MKKGYDIQQFVEKVHLDMGSKHDYVIDTRDCEIILNEYMEEDGHHVEPLLALPDNKDYPTGFYINDTMAQQMSSKLEMPIKYWHKCLKEAPELFQDNVNHWLHEKPTRKMVRTMENTGRAFLSDRFACIDNFDVLEAVLPTLKRHEVDFKESYITDDKMYLRASIPSIARDINPQVGDVVEFGVLISNSETGLGKVKINPMLHRLACLNGMIVQDKKFAVSRKHIGARWDIDVNREVLREETIYQNDKAWLMTVQDQMNDLFNGQTFEEISGIMLKSHNSEPVERPKKAVEEITKIYKFSEMEADDVLAALYKGDSKQQDHNKWGMSNAITAAASNCGNADRAIEMETIGWEVLSLNSGQWTAIAQAA